MSITKRQMTKRRMSKLARRSAEYYKMSSAIKHIYYKILKNGYKATCKESLLSPGNFIIELKKCHYTSDGRMHYFYTEQYTLRPCSDRYVRF